MKSTLLMRLYSLLFLLFFSTLLPLDVSSTSLPAGAKDQLEQTANHFATVIEKSKPAVVYIHVTKKTTDPTSSITDEKYQDNPVLKDWFGDKKKKKDLSFLDSDTSYGFGSGFLYNRDGYILTNSHVIKNAKEVTITLADKSKHEAKIIGSDPKTDIGLLKINATNLPFLPLGDSDKEKPGYWVLAIGSPYEFTQTVTAGIISATGRSTVGISDYEDFIQTDAAINPGNSGGPLININGEVIGINTAFMTKTGGYMGIGFAIPINMARLVTEQLITKGKVTRAWLGVGLVDATPREMKQLKLAPDTGGAKVVKLKKESPATRAGLIKKDIITRMGNTPIKGAADLRNRIALTPPETPVELEYYRNGLVENTQVILGVMK
jgi:serine protease Do